MTVLDSGPSAGLISRVKGILLKPGTEWGVIENEPATVKGLFTGYAAPLAAIAPVCTAIGMVFLGRPVLGVTVRDQPFSALCGAVLSYLLSLLGVFVLGMIIDVLAPTFGGERSKVQAMKVAIYSATAAWVAGVFALVPAMALLSIIGGVYTLYLFFKGAPRLMKVADEKAVGFVVVVIVAVIVVQLVILAVAGAFIATLGIGAVHQAASQERLSGTIKLGGTEVDLAKLQAASKQMEAASKQLQGSADGKAASVPAVPAETLKGLLPDNIAGYARTEIETGSGGVGGIQGSNAQGVYTKGDARITLNVTDMAAAGGLAGLAGAFNVNSSKETATGYEKIGRVDGRMTTDRYDRQSRDGEYSVLVGDRFMISAEGSGVGPEDLKAAVAAVGLSRLEGLAKG